MKLRNIFIMSAFAGLVLTSCNYTDVDPIDSITDQSYWKNVNDLKLYANGLYDYLPGPTAVGDNTSDNFVPRTYAAILFDETTIPSSGGTWGNDYIYVRNCNYFMSRYSTVQGDEAEINKYVGEVRFFRALLYFDLIKTYGDVPYYDHDLQTTDTEELYKARDPRNYVLGKIIEDLEFAIEWLPSSDASGYEQGRLNKDAARTELARICLYYGTYMKYHGEEASEGIDSNTLLKKAADLTQDVMNTGKYSIVKGQDSDCDQRSYDGYPLYYSNLFTTQDLVDGEGECILARHYEEGTLCHETGRQVGENGTGLTKDFVESFLMKDGTPIFNEGSGYLGDETMIIDTITDDGVNDIRAFPSEFVGRDPRIYQIIENGRRPYLVQSGVRTHCAVGNMTSASNSVTGYPCVKYRSANSKQAEARNTSYDWFVFRYAEVLLINAEANAELGTCTNELLDRTINLLRDRVGMAHLTITPVADAKPIDYGYKEKISNLLYEIRRERRIELIAEDFRFDDLHRWNAMKLLENPKTMFGIKVTDNTKAYFKIKTTGKLGVKSTAEYDGAIYLYQYGGENGKNIYDPAREWKVDDRRWLDPIPQEEITLYQGKLVQNKGWE